MAQKLSPKLKNRAIERVGTSTNFTNILKPVLKYPHSNLAFMRK
jgi:hypothetical protein